MGAKGQSALEAAFVVLFIAVAIVAIFAKATTVDSHIGEMANARMLAQETANQLTIRGVATHLVRVDPRDDAGAGSLVPVTIYVVSEKCEGQNSAKEGFTDAFGDADMSFIFYCNPNIYNRIPISKGPVL